MSYGEFLVFLDDNMFNVIFISLITLILYLILFRKHIHSIFDPLFTIVVISALANSTVFYLYFDNQIRYDYFQSFIITEVFFLLGFFLIKPFRTSPDIHFIEKKWYDSSLFISILFYWSSIIHVFFQLLTYSVVGLPILMDSRLTAFAGGSGFGFIGRVIDVVGAIGTILLFYRMFYLKQHSREKVFNYIYLLFIVFFLIVSGNKTNLVFLVYYLFLLQTAMLRFIGKDAIEVHKKITNTQTWLFLISLPLIFFVIYVQYVNTVGTSDDLDLLSSLSFRILSFGDVYYMTLPHDVILRMNHSSGFMQVFKDFLGTYRIVPWQNLPVDCGIEIMSYHAVVGSNVNVGPNARYNYFAILYFGALGQALYCFVLGLSASFMRNTLYRKLPNRMIWVLFYILLNFNLIFLLQDQAYTFGHDLNILLVLPILFAISGASYLIVMNWKKLISKTDLLNE